MAESMLNKLLSCPHQIGRCNFNDIKPSEQLDRFCLFFSGSRPFDDLQPYNPCGTKLTLLREPVISRWVLAQDVNDY